MNLTELRKEKHFTMTDLASQLGISQGHLSNLENGHRPMPDDLIQKIAPILGEPVEVVAGAAHSQNYEDTKLRSWLSNVRINGLPLSKAFKYYLESKGNRDAVVNDEALLKQELRRFIEENIAYSVVAEMTENKNLVPNLRMHIAENDRRMKETNTHEQSTGNQ
jgi:transcriptional regulator with XRE-family HTH domain